MLAFHGKFSSLTGGPKVKTESQIHRNMPNHTLTPHSYQHMLRCAATRSMAVLQDSMSHFVPTRLLCLAAEYENQC